MSTPTLDVFAYAFADEAASLAAYQATMRLIAGGSAYRLHTSDGSAPPMLAVFAVGNGDAIRAACAQAGGTPAELDPALLGQLAARSLHAAQRGIVGQRHHTPGTPADRALPDRQDEYTPRS